MSDDRVEDVKLRGFLTGALVAVALSLLAAGSCKKPYVVEAMEDLTPYGSSKRPSWATMLNREGEPFIDFGEGLVGQDIRVHMGPVSGHDGCSTIAECVAEGLPHPNDCDGDPPIRYPLFWSHCHNPGCTPSVPIEPRREDPASLEPGEPFANSGLWAAHVGGYGLAIQGEGYGDSCGTIRTAGIGGVFVSEEPAEGIRLHLAGFTQNPPNAPGLLRVRTYAESGAITCERVLDPPEWQPKLYVSLPQCQARAFSVDAVGDYQAVQIFHVQKLEMQ